MGTKGREIVGLDVDDLLEMLNKALADEWLAYYQYWVGAKLAKGPMRGTVAAELLRRQMAGSSTEKGPRLHYTPSAPVPSVGYDRSTQQGDWTAIWGG